MTSSEKPKQVENFSNNTNNNLKQNRSCMHGLIRQAVDCLEEFTDPGLSKEQQIPFQILNEAKGIVFLTLLKGAIGVGGTFGTGIIIVRDKENSHQWNGPIAISLNGIQLGLNVGVQQSDHIIILRDDADIDTFVTSGQFLIEGSASLALGTIGRDTNITLAINEKGYMSSASYSLAKGAYIGISLEGQVMMLQHECNDEYFGMKTNPSDVFKGIMKPVEVDEEYNKLCKMLNDYIFEKKSQFLSTFIKDEISHATPTATVDASTSSIITGNEKKNVITTNNNVEKDKML